MLKVYWNSIRTFVTQRKWVYWLLAVLFFFSSTWFYMGNSINDCSTATMSFNSDTTGGLGWAQWVSGNNPRWSYSTKTNYPEGEPLNKPQDITSEGFNVPYRLLASVTTPTCGLNLMLIVGFMSNALVMFGLVWWLFKRPSIALFAGYAASFTPYHLFKAQSHVPYVFSSLFIGIVWLYIWYKRQPSYKRLIPLAMLSALSFFFNGYYILITAVLLVGLNMSELLLLVMRYSKAKRPKDKYQVVSSLWLYSKHFIACYALLVLLLTPIAVVQIKERATIEKSLAAARGDIGNEAKAYSARPAEFVLPAFNNPLLPEAYKTWRLKRQHMSNPSENSLYLGLVVTGLATWGVLALWRKPTRKLTMPGKYTHQELVIILLTVIVACAAVSFPPRFTLFGHTIYTPTLLVLAVTESWRVFARFILVIQPLVVILAAGGLYVLSKKLKPLWFRLFVAACLLVTFLEFLPSPRALSGDLQKNTPLVYHQIAKDASVDVLAEYPLTDFAYAPSLFTYQQIHGKSLINASSPALDQKDLNKSIAGLNDLQTMGVLKSIGVDVVTSRGARPIQLGGLTAYTTNPTGDDPNNLYVFRNTNVRARPLALVPTEGFQYFSVDKRQVSHRVLVKEGTMLLQKVTNQAPTGSYNVSFVATPMEKSSAAIIIRQNGATIWQGKVTPQNPMLSFSTSRYEPLTISTSSPVDIINLSATQP